MAWNDYITSNGWTTPRYGECHILKSDTEYASSYSDLYYDIRLAWDAPGESHSYDLQVINDTRYPIYLVLFDSTGEPNNSRLTSISPLYSATYYQDIIINSVDYFHGQVNMDTYPIDAMASGYPGNNPFAYPTQTLYCEIITNMPIIAVDANSFTTNDLYSLRADYLNNGDLSIFDEYFDNGTMILLNEAEAPEPDTEYFTIYNTAQKGIYSKSGYEYISGPYYRWARLKLNTTSQVDGRIAFYREGLDDGIIKLIPILGASVYSCEYSTDGGANWLESDSFPYAYIYGERINEMGEMIHATRDGIGGNTGIPLFATEEEAQGWVDHDPDVDISDALNYSDLADRYGIKNPTGADEVRTTMGTNSDLCNMFSQKVLCNKHALNQIKEGLFDTGSGGIWENIKQGIDMFGENPINAVCGLMYFPMSLESIFTNNQSQAYVYFGGYYFRPDEEGLQAMTVYRVNGYSGYVDIGTFTVQRAFTPAEDVRNFEPYCNMSIYLPYIGMQHLSYNKYVGKTVKVRYYIDIDTGGCLCCLFADDILMDYFNGQMGVQLPITLTDYAGYASAQLENLSNLAGVGGNMTSAGLNAASGNVAGAAISSAGTVAGFAQTLYDVSTTNLDNFNQTKGASGAIGNGYLPQYVYVIFEYVQTDETSNLINLAGRASNASGSLNSFSGFLQVDDVTLRPNAGMSESEKAEFISLLHSGIII